MLRSECLLSSRAIVGGVVAFRGKSQEEKMSRGFQGWDGMEGGGDGITSFFFAKKPRSRKLAILPVKPSPSARDLPSACRLWSAW